MKKYFFLGLVFFVFLSCTRRENELYIPREKFIAILTDIHIADAYYSTHYYERRTHSDSVNLYDMIYENHGYSKAQFDTTLKYYSVHSEKFDRVYEEVITRLSKSEQDIYQNRPLDSETTENLWYGKNSWYLPEEGARRKVPVSLKLKGKGKYVVSFTYKIYDEDQSKNLRLNLFFSDSASTKMDTLKTVVYVKDARTTIVNVPKDLTDSTYTHLKGYILDHDEKHGRWKKRLVIEGFKVYYSPVQ
jgi:hypothetical protein